MKIRYQSDNTIALSGPVNADLDAAVALSPPPTVTASLYHERKEVRTVEFVTRLTLDEPSTVTVIALPKTTPAVFEAADTLAIDQDNGTVHETTIVSVNVGNAGFDEVTITAGLTAAASAGSTVRLTKKGGTSVILVIQSPGGPIALEKGDTVVVDRDIGAATFAVNQVRTITSVEDAANVTATVARNQATFECIELSAALSGAVSSGRSVRRKLGTDITMASFGTFPTSNPLLGDSSWGFRGLITDAHVGLEIGMTVRIEVIFNGGADLQMVKSLRANVVEG